MLVLRSRGPAIALFTCAILLVAGVAAGGERAVMQIDTVEVMAGPIVSEESVALYGGKTISVGRQQIEDLNAYDLPSALRMLPGVTISRYNLVGSYGGGEGGSVYIRGQGAGRPGSEIKVDVDGAPREVGVWSHPVMDAVPIDYASNIEVHKGPQPYDYPGTFGTIDLTTMQRVRPGYETSLDLTFGEYNTRGAVVRHGGKIQAFDYYAGVTHRESRGHRDHADGKIASQFLRLGLDVARGVHVGYILERTDNWSRDPGRADVDDAVPERDRFATETLTHNLRLDHDGVRMGGYAVLYHEDGRIRWEKDHLSGPETPAGNSDTDWNNYGFRGSEDVRWGELVARVGLEVEDEGGESRNTTLGGTVPFQYEGRFTTVMPALAARYRIDVGGGGSALIPSLGLRYYDHSRFPSETAPHAGLRFQSGEWTVFATYSRGVSYPGVYAVGVAAGTIEGLEAEVLDHAEAGVSVTRGMWMNLQASVFSDRADNLMQYTADGLVNVRDYEVTGLEISSTVDPRRDLSLYGAVTLLEPGYEETPRAPAFSAAAGMTWGVAPGLHMTLDLEYVDEQYAFNGRAATGEVMNIEKLTGYFLAGAGIRYDMSDHFPGRCELSLAIDNLTDEVYAFQPGYPMPGRTLFLTARLGSR